MAMMLVGGYAILAANFNTEVAKTQAILREALQTQPTARIEEALHPNQARQKVRIVKTLRALVLVTAAVSLFVFLIVPTSLRSSDKFHIAQQYIENDATLRSELGSVTSVEPDRWHGLQETTSGAEGSATFALYVTGSSGHGVVTVRMAKDRGVWKVASAVLNESNGRTIALGAVR